jgi:NADP-dependent 3-hydroxy acid dehydrogenase YdfG
MTETTELSGRTAVVTGASSGIGRAIAETFGEHGAHVVLCGRERSAMEASLARIEAAGGRGTIVTADVRDVAAMRGLVDTAVAATGRLDVFVNNAGVSFLGNVLDADPESWRLMLDTNVLALLVGCQAAVRAMRAGGHRGHIVNISSVAALDPTSGVYGATKHAVNVITNTLRDELKDDPIKVTSVMPGLVATNIARNVDPAIVAGLVAMSGVAVEYQPGERIPDEVLVGAQAALSEIMMRPEDIAAAVLFAVTQPVGVDVTEIVVRPNKPVDL